MDDIIVVFCDTYLSDEYKAEVFRSFQLFDFFEYRQASQGFIDILNDANNISSDDLKDRFTQELHDKLDFMLNEHTVKLTDEATIHEKNELLYAFGLIQHLEDYTGVIRILESFEDNETQLSLILEDLCVLDQTQIMMIVESFQPKILATLKAFIYQKESEETTIDDRDAKILRNLRQFFGVHGKDNIAYKLIEANMLVGARFTTYLPYVEGNLVEENNDATALNILSLIYMSIDGFNNPLLMYRKYSYQLLHDLNKVSAIEVLVMRLMAKFNEAKDVQNEKDRLSQTSHKS